MLDKIAIVIGSILGGYIMLIVFGGMIQTVLQHKTNVAPTPTRCPVCFGENGLCGCHVPAPQTYEDGLREGEAKAKKELDEARPPFKWPY